MSNAGSEMTEDDFDNMTDEEIMEMVHDPVSAPRDEDEDEDASTAPVDKGDGTLEYQLDRETAVTEDEPEDEPDASSESDDSDDSEEPTEEEPAPASAGDKDVADRADPHHTTPQQTEGVGSDETEDVSDAGDDSDAGDSSGDSADENTDVDYKAAYEQVMSTFRANGRDFKPESPEEAIRLMQMGANYTQKMQALKPNLKLMRMLENNDLLTEEKLTYLIDLDKKDPKAIQKLLHDGAIDPLDLDTSEEPTYQPGNHAVSDQEMAFHDTWEDVTSNPSGQETVKMIDAQWDQASKDAVYREPVLLKIIDEQRSNGIYDKIVSEMDRQSTLGTLPQSSFIDAYRHVGSQLQASGALAPPSQQATPANPSAPAQGQVVGRRTGSGKTKVDNNAKAKAASPSRSAPAQKRAPFDPFSMSDEEIMALESPRG